MPVTQCTCIRRDSIIGPIAPILVKDWECPRHSDSIRPGSCACGMYPAGAEPGHTVQTCTQK